MDRFILPIYYACGWQGKKASRSGVPRLKILTLAKGLDLPAWMRYLLI